MNILSHKQMKQKQKKLLLFYNQGQVKFKLSLQQLVQAKNKKKDMFCFKRADKKIKLLIGRLVPLNKRVQMVSLSEEQNGLFKVLAFVFLFIIYKRKDQANQHVKNQIKCSLYSDDIDLLQTRNHSFNKKMKSDTIKSVIAVFFKQIQQLRETDLVLRNELKPQDLIMLALQKNDLVAEGFHLFFRNILSKLQVQNANNCIQDVNPEEAISNLIEYFQIDYKASNGLFLFNQTGVFIAKIERRILAFGKYYGDELENQQTSQEQEQEIARQNPQLQLNLKEKSSFQLIQKQDVNNFNSILDTDRDESDSSGYMVSGKTSQAEVPPIPSQFAGQKGKCQQPKQHDSSFIKLKDRLYSQRINEIQSEEQDIQRKIQYATTLRVGLQPNQTQQNKINPLSNLKPQNDDEDEDQYDAFDQAPSPILGAAQLFNFGHKMQKISVTSNCDYNQVGIDVPNKLKQLTARRQSYQGNNSNQIGGLQNRRVQMKKSKNQIQVIDQTASRVSNFNNNQLPKKQSDEYINQRKQTIGCIEKMSSFSNCTCHLQKKNRIRLNSQIIQVVVQSKDARDDDDTSNLLLRFGAKQLTSPKNSANQNKTFLFKSNNTHLKGNPKSQNQNQKPKLQVKQADLQKRQQFLKFLKKDKSELIKKLSEKRTAKNITRQGDAQHHNENGNMHRNRIFIKQSMFVGSHQLINPEKYVHGKDCRTITTGHSIDKNMLRHGRDRSITPVKNIFHFKTVSIGDGQVDFKQGLTNQENTGPITSINNNWLNQSPSHSRKGIHPPVNIQKPPVSFRSPISTTTHGSIRHNTQSSIPTNAGNKPCQFYFKN